MAVKKKTKTRAKTGVKRKTKTAVKRKAVKKAVKKTVRKTVKKTAVKKKAVKKTAKKAKRKGSGGLSKLSYTISEDLQEVIGCKCASRPEVVKKLWAYIKSRKCQDTQNRRMIIPDAKLAKVIGSRPVDMMKLAGLLSKHLKAA